MTRTVAAQIRVRWQKAQIESNNAALAVSAANPRAANDAIFQPETTYMNEKGRKERE